MKHFLTPILCGLALVITGCESRSISDSDYRRGYDRQGNPFYKGELTELDILGVAPAADVSEESIRKALACGATEAQAWRLSAPNPVGRFGAGRGDDRTSKDLFRDCPILRGPARVA